MIKCSNNLTCIGFQDIAISSISQPAFPCTIIWQKCLHTCNYTSKIPYSAKFWQDKTLVNQLWCGNFAKFTI